jgi:hypothetical protein
MKEYSLKLTESEAIILLVALSYFNENKEDVLDKLIKKIMELDL